MFKKRSKPKALKKHTADDDEEESEVVESKEAATVQAVKRRRQVLTGLQYKHGVDAATLSSSTEKAIGIDKASTDDDDSKLPSNTKMTNESQVWKERHQKAMEEYIQSKIQEAQHQTVTDHTVKETKEEEKLGATIIISKDQLFQQLAEAAKKLSGKNEPEAVSEQKLQHQEVLRSGAATAMAEVILPSSSYPGPVIRQHHPINRRHKKEESIEESSGSNNGCGRVGFAVARGIPEIKPREPSADEKAYKNFVQRQRR